jgi:hypothetical protein
LKGAIDDVKVRKGCKCLKLDSDRERERERERERRVWEG